MRGLMDRVLIGSTYGLVVPGFFGSDNRVVYEVSVLRMILDVPTFCHIFRPGPAAFMLDE